MLTVDTCGDQPPLDVGEALKAIRDDRLYRETHKTFEDYCRERWNLSKTHSNRLIAAHDVTSNLTPIGVKCGLLPSNEGQIRPLTKLEPEQQREAWRDVIAQPGPISGPKVEAAVVELLKRQTGDDHRADSDGAPDYDGDEW